MHLSREEIAHVTGMTPVHASRTWTALVADGLIRCAGRHVTVVDEALLAALGDYAERDGDFDYDWLGLVEEETIRSVGQSEALDPCR